MSQYHPFTGGIDCFFAWRHPQKSGSDKKLFFGTSEVRGHTHEFLKGQVDVAHKKTVTLLKKRRPAQAIRYRCNDGFMEVDKKLTDSKIVGFSCAKGSSNAGCRKTVSCPSGKRIVDWGAACHLESSSLKTRPPWGKLQVVTPSDGGRGHCWMGPFYVKSRKAHALPTADGTRSSIEAGCVEYDKNGGDCVIKGQVLCM